jgi:hypothetical protein
MSDLTQYTEPSQGVIRGHSKVVDFTRSFEPAGNLVQMTYPHAAVHRDVIINANNRQAAGTTDVLYFITTGSPLQLHLEYAVIGSAAVQVLFYEGPTVDAAGTAITTTRLFRPSTKTTQAVVTVGGTVTGGAYGVLLKHQSNGGGGTGSGTRGGSAVHDDAEWVLKLNTTYCMRVIRDASGTLGVEFEWYEVAAL